MKNIFINFIKKIIPLNFYKKVRIFIFWVVSIFNLKKKFYNHKQDLNINEKILNNIFPNNDKKKIIKILKKNNIDYYDENISWHYHFAAALSLNKSNIKILEIGTFKANYTNFLSKVFKKSVIYTIDMEDVDIKKYVTLMKKNDDKFFSKIYDERKNNIFEKNIIFKRIDSLYLLDNFQNNSFDFIWVDGDHLSPQVQIDLFSSLKLIKKDGFILCDDVIKNNYKNEYVDNSSFKTIEYLTNKKLITTYFIIKRVWKENHNAKKYISVSKKK
jgi:hypothetical protein